MTTHAEQCLIQFDSLYTLGVETMDNTHREFLALVMTAANATHGEFSGAFDALFQHTHRHFSHEESIMKEIGHGALNEHQADHQRILGDMDRFNQRALAGKHTMAKAWVQDSLILWFHTHAQTMDSALAADIKESGLTI